MIIFFFILLTYIIKELFGKIWKIDFFWPKKNIFPLFISNSLLYFSQLLFRDGHLKQTTNFERFNFTKKYLLFFLFFYYNLLIELIVVMLLFFFIMMMINKKLSEKRKLLWWLAANVSDILINISTFSGEIVYASQFFEIFWKYLINKLKNFLTLSLFHLKWVYHELNQQEKYCFHCKFSILDGNGQIYIKYFPNITSLQTLKILYMGNYDD